eukprot:SAG11_NODE_9248_length_928_cov_78.284680_2_plen_87_part_00
MFVVPPPTVFGESDGPPRMRTTPIITRMRLGMELRGMDGRKKDMWTDVTNCKMSSGDAMQPRRGTLDEVTMNRRGSFDVQDATNLQ